MLAQKKALTRKKNPYRAGHRLSKSPKVAVGPRYPENPQKNYIKLNVRLKRVCGDQWEVLARERSW